MQNFWIFAHLKPTFSILHSHFYKTPISIYLLYKFIQIKYSKPFVSWVSYAMPIHTPDQPTHKNIQPTHQNPSHHQLDQYPSKPTINSINTHGSIPIKTHHQPNQNPSYCRFAKPTHHVPKSFATTSFLGVVRHGLPVDLNEPPPCIVLSSSRASWVSCIVVLESSELLRWSP